MAGLTELESEFTVQLTAGMSFKYKLKRENNQTTIECTCTTADGSHTVTTTHNQILIDAKALADAAAHLKYLIDAKLS